MTGKCIASDRNVNLRTCEIEAWCPVERSKPPLYVVICYLYDTLIKFNSNSYLLVLFHELSTL